MAKLSAAEFAAFLLARAKKKDGYIMGAVGQNPKKWGTGSWYFTQYSGAQRTKALYWRENAERVWDCQGLAEGYINDCLKTNINVYARTNYAQWCDPKGTGKIPVAYRKPGAAVFYHNGNRVTHVGYLVRPVKSGNPAGDWYVVEARGVMYGVVKTKLNSRSWNRWGLMTKYFDYGTVEPEKFEFGERALSLGCEGDDVKELQSILIELGYGCSEWGADGVFGTGTEKALIKFQKANDLSEDGIMNQDDFDVLRDAFKDDSPEDEEEPITEQPITEPEIVPADPTDYMSKKIIDISRWNRKIADAKLLKESVAFVIHRTSCGLTKDMVFDYDADLMRKNSIPFGVYHYIQALNLEAAREEAHLFYQTAMPYIPKFWALDCEYPKITVRVRENGPKFANKIVEAFRDELISLGVKKDRIGVYIGHHLYKLWKLDYESFAFVWIPRYGQNTNEILKKYFPAYTCDLHQYTSRGQCPGINDKTIDLNRITGKGKSVEWFRGEK